MIHQQVSPQWCRCHHNSHVPGEYHRIHRSPGRELWTRQRAADVWSSASQRDGREICFWHSSERYQTVKLSICQSDVCKLWWYFIVSIYPWRADMSAGGGFCWTVRGLSAQRLRIHRGLRAEDECWGECPSAAHTGYIWSHYECCVKVTDRTYRLDDRLLTQVLTYLFIIFWFTC